MKKYFKWVVVGVVSGALIGGALSYHSFFQVDFGTIENELRGSQVIVVNEPTMTLSIASLNIKAPIIEGIDPSNEEAYNENLKNGVLLMPGTGEIGKPGNAVIYGHSSADKASPYQKIFATLSEVEGGDKVVVSSNGIDYVYIVSGKKVVEADDFSILEHSEDEIITLLTCWPLGTDEKRLVLVAKRQ